jgi:hypothetical protein
MKHEVVGESGNPAAGDVDLFGILWTISMAAIFLAFYLLILKNLR